MVLCYWQRAGIDFGLAICGSDVYDGLRMRVTQKIRRQIVQRVVTQLETANISKAIENLAS
ncbi:MULTISPECIES: hypothetical protein [unclassified Nostoc]|uniref:hypothetical protein n=1 Tax=unclassified Nostoc TaxID=2593658 RepID=UPI0013D19109|nr:MULTISPECIES: hypothetical protein [unclassified Nostoc]MBE8999492.1 hypothetical protein [Nostoc sp. LEGE 12447]NEU79321.1 hypothetical protein [Nostoc sp. UIC 10630]